MRFTSQDLPDSEDATESFLEHAFDERTFGLYAHLAQSDDVFIQAGSRGSPLKSCAPADDSFVMELESFIRRTGSEPWDLEHVDGLERKEHRVRNWLTLLEVKAAFLGYLKSGGDWRQGLDWEEVDSRGNPFPNPMPDKDYESIEMIPNRALKLDHLPAPDTDAAEVWRLADTFNGFMHWGSIDRCAEIANQKPDSNLTELRTCLFIECRRWHHFGELPNEHATPYIRGVVEKIRGMVAANEFD